MESKKMVKEGSINQESHLLYDVTTAYLKGDRKTCPVPTGNPSSLLPQFGHCPKTVWCTFVPDMDLLV